MKTTRLAALGIIPAALFIAACGDDSSSSANNAETDFAFNVETLDDLPTCTKKLEGDSAFVKEENTVHFCRSGHWLAPGESVSTSSSSNEDASSSSAATVESSSTGESSSSSETSSSSIGESSSSSETSSSSTGESSSSSETSLSSTGESSSSSETSSSSIGESSSSPAISYGEMTDSRDGQVYKTVKIGEQTWMAENLNYAYFPDTVSFCYENKPENCQKYGRLYSWSAAMDSAAIFSYESRGCGGYHTYWYCNEPGRRGVCPKGWHLPSGAEVEALFAATGGKDGAGTALKSTSGWNDGGNGTDNFGFSAIPAGFGRLGHFFNLGGYANFWIAAEQSTDNAGYLRLSAKNGSASWEYNLKTMNYSVRCIENE